MGDNILVLPLYPELSYETIDQITEIVKACVVGENGTAQNMTKLRLDEEE